MTYDNFVKTYYRKMMRIIGKYGQYNGMVVDCLPPEWYMKKESLHRSSEAHGFFNYEVDTDAPAEKFAGFLDYSAARFPLLSPLLWSNKALLNAYDFFAAEDDSDETISEVLDIFLESAASALEKNDVLETA